IDQRSLPLSRNRHIRSREIDIAVGEPAKPARLVLLVARRRGVEPGMRVAAEMREAEQAARFEMCLSVLVARKHDRLAADSPFPELQQSVGHIGGKALQRLARLEGAAMREGVRADLLPLARGDAARERRAEMKRIPPLIESDILEAAEYGAAYGRMLDPRDELVLALAKQSANGGPGGPDAPLVEKIEHSRYRLATTQHVVPVAPEPGAPPHAPHQFEIERDDKIARPAPPRPHALLPPRPRR